MLYFPVMGGEVLLRARNLEADSVHGDSRGEFRALAVAFDTDDAAAAGLALIETATSDGQVVALAATLRPRFAFTAAPWWSTGLTLLA